MSGGLVISHALSLNTSFREEAWQPIMLWKSYITTTNIVASSEDENHPASDLANPSTVLFWQSLSLLTQTLTIDPISSEEKINAIAFANHNWHSKGWKIKIQGLTSDPGAVLTEIFPEETLGSDEPAILMFEEAYYIKFVITLTPTAVISDAPPECSVMFAGRVLRIVKGIPPGHIPVKMSGVKTAQDNLSEDGNYIGSVILGTFAGSSLALVDLDQDWYRANLEEFRKLGRGTTFFLCEFPELHSEDVGYCWVTNAARPVINQKNGSIDITFQFGAVVEPV